MKLACAALCALAMVPGTGLAQQTSTEVQKPGEAPPPQKPLTADEAFNARVKTLEEQVVDLKEKIFRTKARLLLLQ